MFYKFHSLIFSFVACWISWWCLMCKRRSSGNFRSIWSIFFRLSMSYIEVSSFRLFKFCSGSKFSRAFELSSAYFIRRKSSGWPLNRFSPAVCSTAVMIWFVATGPKHIIGSVKYEQIWKLKCCGIRYGPFNVKIMSFCCFKNCIRF